LRYETAEISLIGDRDQNQDRVAILCRDDCAFLVVVDGMGGHSEGDKAAEVARRSFIRSFDETEGMIPDPGGFVEDAVRRAHEAVTAIGEGLSVEHKPRATCASCLVLGGEAWWAHVGDARVYLLRSGRVIRRTRDHSHVEVLLREGLIREEEIPGHPMRHYVECCLGGESALPRQHNDPASIGLSAGDTLLVCSDGLWSGVSDEMIGQSSTAGGLVAEWLEALSERARAANAPYSDNTTAAALRLREE
jgi:serine/threonine protein phosphatase PrpC